MSSSSATPAVEMDTVSACYGPVDGWRALQHVDLRVEAGEFLGVIGPNGGGKTTLLKLVTGLLAPSSGRIRVLGTTPAGARCRVGYVAQRCQHDPAFPITVYEVVRMGRLDPSPRSWLPRRRRHADQSVERALRSAGLDQLPHARFGDLSGGQQQRALLARSLISEPELLVLDEPTTGLDPTAVAELHQLLSKLRDHVTVLMVSHATDEVRNLATRIVTVDRHVLPWPSYGGEVVESHA